MSNDKEFAQLKLLFEYTKFHIGLYTTVATIFGALLVAKTEPFQFNRKLLLGAVICICIAGAAGGVIASSIPQYQSYSVFWRDKIGPMRFKVLTAESWTYIEHTFFWIAVVLAVGSIIAK